jgi:hypothetical protein
MCRAIEAAYKVDEVKDIRDQAIALEVYARQAHNTEAERKACEIRLRAERKAGALGQAGKICRWSARKNSGHEGPSFHEGRTAACGRRHAATSQELGKARRGSREGIRDGARGPDCQADHERDH